VQVNSAKCASARRFLAEQLAERERLYSKALLSARQVQVAGEGDHGDGDGLYLRVKVGGIDADTGKPRTTASWVFRYAGPSGKGRELGLGAYFSDRGRRFQRDRGRCFTVIVDGRGCAQAISFIVPQSSMMI
jgi:hypothetical protein